MIGLIFCAIVWLLTDRLEPLLLSAFGTLIAAGYGAEAVVALRSTPPKDDGSADDGDGPDGGEPGAGGG